MNDLPICLLFLGGVLIVPFVLLLGGYVMRNLDSDRNPVVGYRTALSMSSPEAWLYANHTCGQLWKRIGLILLCASPAAMGAALGVLWPSGLATKRSGLICAVVLLTITGVQIGLMLWSIWQVEKELRRRFGKNRPLSARAKKSR